MKKYLLLITLLVPLYKAGAQNQPAASQGGQQLTLEECISYALENNFTIQNAHVDEQIAQDKVDETRGIGLPQVNGSVDVMHNEQLPRFFGMKSPDNPFTSQLPGNDGDVMAMQNPFQLKSSGNASV